MARNIKITIVGISDSMENSTKYPYRECKLFDFGGDVKKKWVIRGTTSLERDA
jgi:hypothetical protein